MAQKAFSNRKREYVPLAFAAVYSAYFLVLVALIGLPLLLLAKGNPLEAWPRVYLLMFALFVPIAVGSCIMAALFGKLAYSDIGLPVGVAVFGAVMPLVLYGALSISVFVWHGHFIQGIATPEGFKNAVFLFVLFGSIGAAIYWSSFRELDNS